MHTFFSFIKNNQSRIALTVGYFLVAALFFNLGRFEAKNTAPAIKIEEPEIDLSKIYDTLNSAGLQSIDPEVAGSKTSDCAGKIKGNIGSSGKIYHVPGGSFYNRTNPELCFDTPEQAVEAGFRKSLR